MTCKKHQHHAHCTKCGERYSIPNGWYLVDQEAMDVLNEWAKKKENA